MKKYIKPTIRMRLINERESLMATSVTGQSTESVDVSDNPIDGTTRLVGSKLNKTIQWDDDEE